VEKGFGMLTLEIDVPFECNVEGGDVSQSIGNIDLGARYPFYQFVSTKGFWDTTFGSAVELGVPTQSAVSKNTELDPKIFNNTKIGEHFTRNPSSAVRCCSAPATMAGGRCLNMDSISATRSSTWN